MSTLRRFRIDYRVQATLDGKTLGDQGGQANNSKNHADLTFSSSKRLPIHRWYPYVEGFSAPYLRRLISKDKDIKNVYDPFAGCGTTNLEASLSGIPSYYSEVNPFMSFIVETKINAARKARGDWRESRMILLDYLNTLRSKHFECVELSTSLDQYHAAFPRRDYFVERDLVHLLAAKETAKADFGEKPYVLDLLLLAIASIAVSCSNMTRRADLRRRRSDEYKERVVDVVESLERKVREIIEDLSRNEVPLAPVERVSGNAMDIPPSYRNKFDSVITSPPYLNGTNYIRNTKIELWLLDFIRSENDLSEFRQKLVPSGITEVRKSTPHKVEFESVEQLAHSLEKCAYDKRIIELPRVYFERMFYVLEQLQHALRPGGRVFMDIGDSKFCGVYVPTDTIITDLARTLMYELVSTRTLAKRYSRDKTPLKQVEIVLRKPKAV